MFLEYTDVTNRVTDEELIQDMKSVLSITGKDSLTIAEYDAFGKHNSTTVIKHFGTWNHALEIVGIRVSNKFYSDEELFSNLADIWMRIGKQPSRRDLRRVESLISYKAYERRFGKWSVALQTFVDWFNTSETSDYVELKGIQPEIKQRTARDVNLRLRFKVMQRDSFKCCLCGASPAKNEDVELHVDHIIPWSKGGESVFENLQTLCSKCNLGKSNLLEQDDNKEE